MGSNPTGFKITDTAAGWNGADFEDVFVRKDCFLEGGLWLWGYTRFGRLGNNIYTGNDRSSPIQTISGGTNWRSVSSRDRHVAGIKTDGTLWLWGLATGGVLGTNNQTISRSSPTQTISGGTNWKQVSLGSQHSGAIKNDGTLWMWGFDGAYGRIGDNTILARSSPVQTISGGTNWKSVSLGVNHSAAIKTDGTLWLWGGGSFAVGVLGINSNGYRSSPVQTVSGGTNWKSVSAGKDATGAIKTDGTLWLWGSGASGRLGDNSSTSRSSPVQTISGGTNWKSVSVSSANNATVLAIKTDGTLWSWGYGNKGMLGNNSSTSRSSPVQTISGGNNWRSIAANMYDTAAAIKTDGTLWLWGYGLRGRIGDNSIIDKSSPVQTISGGTSWRTSITTRYISAAIREDCW